MNLQAIKAYLLHVPAYLYLTSCGIALVIYFAVARYAQDVLYRARRPFPDYLADAEFFGYYLKPEPYELPLYLAGYLVVPLLALLILPLMRFGMRPRVRRGMLMLAVGGVFLTAGYVAWTRIIPDLDFYGAYFRSRSLSHVTWLLFTKRMFFLRIAGVATLGIFLAAYLAVPRLRFGWMRSRAVHAALARWEVLFLLLLVLLIFNPSLPYDEHHYNYMLGPAIETVHGKAILSETPTQYGIFSTYVIMGIIRDTGPHAFSVFSFVVFASYALYYVLLYLFIRRWLGSTLFAWLGITAILAVSYFLQVSPTLSAFHFPGLSPFRIGLYVIALFLFLWYARARTRRDKRVATALLLMLAGFAPLWIIDAGVYVAVSTVLTLAVLTGIECRWRLWDVVKRWLLLGVGYLAAFTLGLSVVTAIHLARYGMWPNWPIVFAEVGQFGKGLAQFPLPHIGIFEAYIFVYLATALVMLRRFIQGRATDPPMLFLTLYGIFSFQYYIGTSSWTLLYHIAPPMILLVLAHIHEFFVTRNGDAKMGVTTHRIAAAGFVALAFFIALVLAAKVPVEIANRDYHRFPRVLREVRPEDKTLYEDALLIRREFAAERRLAFIHPRTTKLTLFTDRANLLPFFTLDQMFRERQALESREVVRERGPRYVFLGVGENNRVLFFRSQLPALGYQKVRILNEVEVYERKN